MAVFRKRTGLEPVPEEPVPFGFSRLTPKTRSRMLADYAQAYWAADHGTELAHAYNVHGKPIRQGDWDAFGLNGEDRPSLIWIRAYVDKARKERAVTVEQKGSGPVQITHHLTAALPPEVDDQLDSWFTDSDGRTWQRGTPWPVTEAPAEDWRPLQNAAITNIEREHQKVHNHYGEDAAYGTIWHCYDPRDGSRKGTELDEHLAKRLQYFVLVLNKTHPDDLDLAAIRVCPNTGKVRPNACPVKVPA